MKAPDKNLGFLNLFSLSISKNYIVSGQMAYNISQILQRNINF